MAEEKLGRMEELRVGVECCEILLSGDNMTIAL